MHNSYVVIQMKPYFVLFFIILHSDLTCDVTFWARGIIFTNLPLTCIMYACPIVRYACTMSEQMWYPVTYRAYFLHIPFCIPASAYAESIKLIGGGVFRTSIPCRAYSPTSETAEKVQKRAIQIIAGYDQNYQQTLRRFSLDTLADRRQMLFLRLGKQIILNSNTHRELLPKFRDTISCRRARKQNTLETFRCGARLRNSSIPLITTHINSDILSTM